MINTNIVVLNLKINFCTPILLMITGFSTEVFLHTEYKNSLRCEFLLKLFGV